MAAISLWKIGKKDIQWIIVRCMNEFSFCACGTTKPMKKKRFKKNEITVESKEKTWDFFSFLNAFLWDVIGETEYQQSIYSKENK